MTTETPVTTETPATPAPAETPANPDANQLFSPDKTPPSFNYAVVTWFQPDGNIEQSPNLYRGLLSICDYLSEMFEKDANRQEWPIEVSIYQKALVPGAAPEDAPVEKNLTKKLFAAPSNDGSTTPVTKRPAREIMQHAVSMIIQPEYVMGSLQANLQNGMNCSSLKAAVLLAVFEGLDQPLHLPVLTTSEPMTPENLVQLMEGLHKLSEDLAFAIEQRYQLHPSWKNAKVQDKPEVPLIVSATTAQMNQAIKGAQAAPAGLRIVK